MGNVIPFKPRPADANPAGRLLSVTEETELIFRLVAMAYIKHDQFPEWPARPQEAGHGGA